MLRSGPTFVWEKNANPSWGWYTEIPGWYTTRPDGLPCARVDWQNKIWKIEVARGALATPVEGKQYGELLPNNTGNYCQELKLAQGAKYKLSYYYGRLMTYGSDKGTHGVGSGTFTAFDSAVDVAIRPSSYQPSAAAGIWPKDRQGYSVISSADSLQQWNATGKQWVQHSVEFTAPSNQVTLAFINAKRSKICGSCGSLLDAVCLQRVSK